MNAPFVCRHISSGNRGLRRIRENGMALVLVLSLIVIFSLLTIAFLFLMRGERVISGNYGSSMASGYLLDAASELIVNEIRQEIRNGSNVSVPLHAAGNSGQEIFAPLNNYFSQPAPIVTADEKLKFPNLIRRSARASFQTANGPSTSNYPFVTYPFTLSASDSATTVPSKNGSRVTGERWNRPALLDPSELASFQAPDWIMMTRDGPLTFDAAGVAQLPGGAGPADPSDPSPDNSSYVLGRFAYVIYTCNNGLDVAAAGGPSSGLPMDLVSRKRILPFADVTSLPGFSSALLDNLVQLRNPSTRNNIHNASDPADPSTFVGWATDTAHGFLRPANGDQRILSRQELLGFLQRNGTDLSSSKIGQYLTVFSREMNSPSIIPNPARPRIQAGFPYEGKDDEYNPSLPGMVYPSDVTIAPDGTLAEPLTLRKGSPLIARRFALSRLAWLTSNGPSALNGGESGGTVSNIKRYFGLTWDATNKRWIYEHGDPDKILSLAELQTRMAVQQREPDFFEILKATIPAGSLALEGNTSTTQPTVADESANLDLHIFKIAANMIDQADGDGYPTILTYSNGGGFPEAFGIEDLPYLNKVYQVFLRPSGLNEIRGYLLPELFRPHYAASSTSPANTPADFRVVIREDSYAAVRVRYSSHPNTPGSGSWPVSWNAPWGGLVAGTLRTFYAADENSSAVTFSVNAANPFTSPAILTDANSNTANPDNKVANDIHSTLYGSGNWTSPNGFTFSNVGQARSNWNLVYVNRVEIPSNTVGIYQAGFYENYVGATLPPPNLTISLQYQAGGSWRTYTEWRNISVPQHTTTDTQGRPPERHFFNSAYHFMKLDPRTDRLGADMLWNGYSWGGNVGVENRTVSHSAYGTSGYRASIFRPWCGTAGVNYESATRFHWDGLDSPANNPGKWQQWTQLQRNTEGASNSYYHDPDGVVRPGDGRYAPQHAGPEANKIGSPLGDTANYVSRPVMLNRPFRSVAELGYVYRDLPWRSLDFFSSESADAAFLDVFTVDENPPVRAGVISLNTPFPEVLQALLKVPGGTLQKQEVSGTTPSSSVADLQMQTAEANNLAAAIVAETKSKPLLTKAELATRLAAGTTVPNAYSSNNSRRIKARRESFVRALTDATETRTWNLMIDLVVQAGKYPAQRPVTNLGGQFVVEAERRIWWHIAIDRYTGEIIDQQIEPVYE